MVDDARGHDRDIVDKPQKSVDEGIYPAYPGALLHYGGGKEASRDEHEDIEGRGIPDDVDGNEKSHKDEGEPYGEFLLADGEYEA